MIVMHLALGAMSSIFGAYLSWAVTDWIIEKKRDGQSVFWTTVLSVTGVVVLVVALGVVMSNVERGLH